MPNKNKKVVLKLNNEFSRCGSEKQEAVVKTLQNMGFKPNEIKKITSSSDFKKAFYEAIIPKYLVGICDMLEAVINGEDYEKIAIAASLITEEERKACKPRGVKDGEVVVKFVHPRGPRSTKNATEAIQQSPVPPVESNTRKEVLQVLGLLDKMELSPEVIDVMLKTDPATALNCIKKIEDQCRKK